MTDYYPFAVHGVQISFNSFFLPFFMMDALILALDLVPIARVKYQDGSLTSTLQAQVMLLQLGLLTGAGRRLGIIFLYLLAENRHIFPVDYNRRAPAKLNVTRALTNWRYQGV